VIRCTSRWACRASRAGRCRATRASTRASTTTASPRSPASCRPCTTRVAPPPTAQRPRFLMRLCVCSCPEDSMVLVEEAWNAYPHCVTVITNGYLAKHKFYICIESVHLADRGDTENAIGMSNNELSQRKVEVYVSLYLDRCCRSYRSPNAPARTTGWTFPTACRSRRCRTTATPPRYAAGFERPWAAVVGA